MEVIWYQEIVKLGKHEWEMEKSVIWSTVRTALLIEVIWYQEIVKMRFLISYR